MKLLAAMLLVVGTTVGTVTPAQAVVAPPDIPVANVQAHLTELQRIATANGGNGRTGGPATAHRWTT